MSDDSESSGKSSSNESTDALSESRTTIDSRSREFSEVKQKSGSSEGVDGPSASEVGAGHIPADMKPSGGSSGDPSSSSSSSESNSSDN